ncbi:Glycoprotein endo-alpha-1,2-mannosidase-like protein [Trichinella pseudospiralis]|uniref:E3 ubiquitin-protein ligase ZNRF1 n=1 Tax=Trichinella pseudospiralis TaxID=6337 RepID=A0A0V1JMT5_TRIPS|nr:Glycoprotein endo-alpha-1,2-mannosidase-like protein [Trichinella pseudospiralis]KRZ36263.1 Glycoprotein endo-alpha-1,2-mannosidase-like protein [Trichinella pseudospiralis]
MGSRQSVANPPRQRGTNSLPANGSAPGTGYTSAGRGGAAASSPYGGVNEIGSDIIGRMLSQSMQSRTNRSYSMPGPSSSMLDHSSDSSDPDSSSMGLFSLDRWLNLSTESDARGIVDIAHIPSAHVRYFDMKCPVCHKMIPSDDVECHLVMCLTRPRLTYNEDVLTEEKGECVICLEEMKEGDTIARLPCLCIYHKGCIDNWFKVKNTCPEHPVLNKNYNSDRQCFSGSMFVLRKSFTKLAIFHSAIALLLVAIFELSNFIAVYKFNCIIVIFCVAMHFNSITFEKSISPRPVFVRKSNSEPDYSVHIFYYMWYGNVAFDQFYLHWNHRILPHYNPLLASKYLVGRREAPEDIGSNFYPKLGCYSSRDPEILAQHMQWIRDAGIGVVVVGWYPPDASDDEGHPWDDAIPSLLLEAYRWELKVCFLIEPYKGRNGETIRTDIEYILQNYGSHEAFYKITTNGISKPVFYVYDSYLVSNSDWQALLLKDGKNTIRNTDLDTLLVKRTDTDAILTTGFDGFFTYFASTGFTDGSKTSNWPDLVLFATRNGLLTSLSVGPGYVDERIRPWNGENTRPRGNGSYYEKMWKAAVDCKPTFVSITSFNEWHEGTQIEPAVPYKNENYEYLNYLPMEEDFYLKLTKRFIDDKSGFQKANDTENLHIEKRYRDFVYPPSEDSYLLLEAIQLDWEKIKTLKPTICLEIGCGSGVIACSVANSLQSGAVVFATDISQVAVELTKVNFEQNNIDKIFCPVVADLISPLYDRLLNSVDLLLFNPPYIPRLSDFDDTDELSSTWCGGGPEGTDVLRRIIFQLHNLLSDNGLFYLVAIEENNIEALLKLNAHLLGKGKNKMASRSTKFHFVELNIVRRLDENEKHVVSAVKYAVEELGYTSVAVNVELSATNDTDLQVPEPLLVDWSKVVEGSKPWRFYTRLTLTVGDVDLLSSLMKNDTVLKYDIIAVSPLSEAIFNFVFDNLEVDLLTTDMMNREVWFEDDSLYRKAVHCGKFIEISYSPAILSAEKKVEVFSHGSELFRMVGPRGIILTSRAFGAFEMRGPYDVINIGYLFGMNPNEARDAITVNPSKLLKAVGIKKRTLSHTLITRHFSKVPMNEMDNLLQVPQFKTEIETNSATEEQ